MIDEKNIGKTVKWVSQSRGSWIEKTGKIVGICPARNIPLSTAQNQFPDHRIMFDSAAPVAKGKERYFVEVRRGNGKPLLYYPRISALEIIEE